MATTRFNAVMFVVLVLALMYVCAYYHYPLEWIQVAQTGLSTATDSLLLEKRPLVIVDCVTNHQDLVKLSALRLLHIRSEKPWAYMHRDGAPHLTASARFTLVYQTHADITKVEIGHPRTQAGAVILLRRHQTLVLPPRWRFTCPDGAIVHELHDCVSLALRALRVTKSNKPK